MGENFFLNRIATSFGFLIFLSPNSIYATLFWNLALQAPIRFFNFIPPVFLRGPAKFPNHKESPPLTSPQQIPSTWYFFLEIFS